MSQFDFPRINFSGQAFINPGTANNNILLPLVTYDPIQVKVLLPPRIYLSRDLLTLHKLDGLPIPENQPIHEEEGLYYIAIESVNNQQTFTDWATTSLGNSPIDAHYHALYELIVVQRTGKPLLGHVPVNWNYYGGMEFGFKDVVVRSVTTSDQQTYTHKTTGYPSEITELLGATLKMEDDKGLNKAVMIDVLPSLAMFSQVFCDVIQLRQEDAILARGKPLKGSLRFLNLHRIVNLDGVLSGSGMFFTVIPLEELEGGMNAPIMRLFQQYGRKKRLIKGVLIRYNLFEVIENQTPDYAILGSEANPAFATVAGSLTPWYDDELRSITMGRQLVPDTPFFMSKSLSSVVCRVDYDERRVRLDLLGSIPEERINDWYETYPLGPLTLALINDDTSEIALGTILIDPINFSRERLLETGGIVDLDFKENEDITESSFANGLLTLYGYQKSSGQYAGDRIVYMRESEYMVASDQAGLYADQGQDPLEGYLSYTSAKEPCLVRIYQRGRPCKKAVPMTIIELAITKSGSSASTNQFLRTTHFFDKQTLLLPTDRAANSMYLFYPGVPDTLSDDFLSDLIKTGFFVSLRVLPTPDYGQYLNPQHPDYPTPVSFDILYEELLYNYDLIFPKASLITPFTEDFFRRGNKYISQRMNPANWDSAAYMPSSRDMPTAKWDLYCKWVTELTSTSESIDQNIK